MSMSVLRSQALRASLRSQQAHRIAPAFTRAASEHAGMPEPQNPLKSFQPDQSTPKAQQQSPNVPTTWSTSQNPKPHAQNNARFEQTNLDLQPNAQSAMGMVAEDPIRLVNNRRASCDGGGGPLGHPRVFINLDKPGPKACGYCGIRFEQAHHH